MEAKGRFPSHAHPTGQTMVSRTEMVKAYSNLLEHLKSKAQRRMMAEGVPSQERATIQVHVNILETTKQVMTEKRHLASAK